MLMRFDPLRDFDPFRDLLTGQATRSPRAVLAMDAVRDEDEVTIYIDVPGVATDDIDVSVEKNELTVSVDRRWADDGRQVLTSERPQGTFSRRIMLSDALDVEQLKAKVDGGVLVIAIPVAERSKPRRIEVAGSASDGEEIETSSGDA